MKVTDDMVKKAAEFLTEKGWGVTDDGEYEWQSGDSVEGLNTLREMLEHVLTNADHQTAQPVFGVKIEK